MTIHKFFFMQVLIVMVMTGSTFGKKDSPCITLNGEEETCLLITDCPVLNEPFLKGSKIAKDIVQQSLCGFEDDVPLVCCGKIYNMSSNYADRLDAYLKDQKKEDLEKNIKKTTYSKELPDRSVCGLEREVTNRIYGGQETRLDEFPWMVALEYRNRTNHSQNMGVRCGGSIINNRYALTAAHCLVYPTLEVYQVRLGEWNTSNSDIDCSDIQETNCADPVIEIGVEKVISHPYYHPRTKNNDIGLIRLSSTINYTDYIRPICLASPHSPPLKFGTPLSVAGWGFTENNRIQSEIKMKAELLLFENSKCKEKFSLSRETRLWIGLNQICVGEEGKDSCEGDSGGPLMRAYEDQLNGQIQWYQEGVVSWGTSICGGTTPAIYTRVRRYRYWIISQLE